MIVSLFTKITLAFWCTGVALSIPLAVYAIVHKLFIQRKGKPNETTSPKRIYL